MAAAIAIIHKGRYFDANYRLLVFFVLGVGFLFQLMFMLYDAQFLEDSMSVNTFSTQPHRNSAVPRPNALLTWGNGSFL